MSPFHRHNVYQAPDLLHSACIRKYNNYVLHTDMAAVSLEEGRFFRISSMSLV